jgi:phosphoserine aminotransferase
MAWNFAAGPVMVAPDILAEAQAALVDWRGSGLSILETPFTGPAYAELQAEAEADLRALLGLGDDWRVLFLQGGASAHFALTAMNLTAPGDGRPADFIITGHWSRRAAGEAAKIIPVHIAAQGDGRSIPPQQNWTPTPNAAYRHVTGNETADGLQFHAVPSFDDSVPLVADMSADLLTRPLDLAPLSLIYAGAQKNLGVAGLTLMLIRRELLGRGRRDIPAPFDYTAQVAADGRVNTPPMFAVLVAALTLRRLRRQGGLTAAARRNAAKARAVYAAIDDAGGFYRCPVAPPDRSLINICFRLPDDAAENRWRAAAEAAGLRNLKGHPATGGVRATLCNAMPQQGAEALADFMRDFVRRWG